MPSRSRSQITIGVLLTALASVAYGAVPLFATLSYSLGSNPSTFNFYKSAFALPLIFLILLFRRQHIGLSLRPLVCVLVAGLLSKGITSFFLYSSYAIIGGGLATTIHYLYPLFVALFGWLFFRQRLAPVKLIGLLGASVSVCLFVDFSGPSGSFTGVLFALLSAVTYALYIQSIEHTPAKTVNPLIFAFYAAIMGAVFAALSGSIAGDLVFVQPPKTMLFVFLGACASSVVGISLFQQGVARLGGASAAIFGLLEPVCSLIFGAVFMDEAFPLRACFGVVLIMLFILAVLVADLREEQVRRQQICRK